MASYSSVKVIDSHTAGEPSRVVIDGGPDLGNGALTERLTCFREQYDFFRSGVVNEPRGSDVVVGAILLEPFDPTCEAAVIYFNNVGYLGMCGHGTIGLVKTLEHMGRIVAGIHKIETPVGTVEANLHADGTVTITNVASYRHAKDVAVEVDGLGTVTGDVAYGGNWFFLIGEHSLDLLLKNLEQLTDFSVRVRDALVKNGITGDNGAEIDHVELFSPTAT